MCPTERKLSDWQHQLQDMYEYQNRRKSVDWIWCRMYEEISELLRPIKKQHLEVINRHLPDILAWTFPFADKRGWSVQEILWERYRDGCPTCGGSPCKCHSMPTVEDVPTTAKRLPPAAQERLPFVEMRPPETIDDWQEYFGRLYGESNRDREPTYFIENLIQDIGKVSKHIRLREWDNVRQGLCSIVAWEFALCNAFSHASADGIYRLSERLAAKYDPVCPHCRKNPCKCMPVLERLFVSWSGSVSEYMGVAEDVMATLGYEPIVFRDLGPEFERGRMVEAFDAIDDSEGAVVLLCQEFSPRVFAEFVKCYQTLEHNFLWIYHVTTEPVGFAGPDTEMSVMLRELKLFHQVPSVQTAEELRTELIRDLKKAREVKSG